MNFIDQNEVFDTFSKESYERLIENAIEICGSKEKAEFILISTAIQVMTKEQKDRFFNEINKRRT